MKKSVITKLGAGVLVAVLLCGCQAGTSDKELVNGTMVNWQKAFIDQDLDKLMSAYSDDYESARGRDKEAVQEFMERAIDEGFLEDIEVTLESAKITIEGDRATVSPVVMTGGRGPMNLEFTLRKEDDTWRIISSDRQRSEESD